LDWLPLQLVVAGLLALGTMGTPFAAVLFGLSAASYLTAAVSGNHRFSQVGQAFFGLGLIFTAMGLPHVSWASKPLAVLSKTAAVATGVLTTATAFNRLQR